ncbi:MAG: hypothetical protein EOP17_00385 [Rhizobiaceae bacterium]|nr:MAG: hypothetical protein EOP17_00385 [Rhizobiaceae bacterium]
MKLLYDILDIARDAPIEAINAAYRREAKLHHPDLGGDPQIFAALQEAIAILRDPRRRAHYDTTGEIIPELDTLRTEDRVADAIERLLHNGIGEDHLGTSLKGRAALIEKKKANNERQALVLAMARDMLKSYGWTFEVSMSPSAHQTHGQTV